MYIVIASCFIIRSLYNFAAHIWRVRILSGKLLSIKVPNNLSSFIVCSTYRYTMFWNRYLIPWNKLEEFLWMRVLSAITRREKFQRYLWAFIFLFTQENNRKVFVHKYISFNSFYFCHTYIFYLFTFIDWYSDKVTSCYYFFIQFVWIII